jgi:hypothetical protein
MIMKSALTTIILAGFLGTLFAKDEITHSALEEGNKVVVSVKTEGKIYKRSFKFPNPISDHKVIPFMSTESVIVAARPKVAGDWFWGIAHLGDDAPIEGTVMRWTKSPPHDAKILSLERLEGDSFVVYAASFKRNFSNANEIKTYAYVNHCPVPVGDRDPVGFLYSGDIGGPLETISAEQDRAGQPATRPEPK